LREVHTARYAQSDHTTEDLAMELSHSTPTLRRVAEVPAGYDLIVVGASAGGHAAVIKMLTGLPQDLSLTVVLLMHLPPEATLGGWTRQPYAVEWVGTGTRIGQRKLLIAPPQSFVELLPNGFFALSACPGGAMALPIDRLFKSVACSFGPRAIGVILTGMGKDGSLGARELRLAGGRTIVQSITTSLHDDMPAAAIAAGAADMVVPLDDIGQVIGEIVAGTPRSCMRSELSAIGRTFGENSEIARLAFEIDWSQTPLESVMLWPDELKLTVRTAIDSPQAMAIWWGPDLIQLYNDRWRVFLGAKHPRALGRPARDTWPEVWNNVIGPIAKGVMTRGEAVGGEDFPLMIDRHGFVEEVFMTFSYSPIRDPKSRVLGVQITAWETTHNVVADRRARSLHGLAMALAGAATRNQACERAADALGNAVADLPFALIYLLDAEGRQATLAGAAGLDGGSPAAPYVISVSVLDDSGWPMAAALAASRSGKQSWFAVDGLEARFPGIAASAGARSAKRALVIALGTANRSRPLGVLILGLSPHRPEDDGHTTFIDQIVQHLSAGIGDALANELERERLDRLAEIDRTRTEFFSNVSHEFRTPLTLMLAPLDELVRQRRALPAKAAESVEVASRNARRLLRLVNSLLDFSAIDVRGRPALVPTDLGQLTTDITAAFRSAIESAGLVFHVYVDPTLPMVPVNAEMWEKIVSNLISNALKFTFTGGISVSLTTLRLHAELEVVDTGVGIPAAELPNIFKRFYRVRTSRARTAEGAGIGLAIVNDLVHRMGGQLSMRSRENSGTGFTIWIPLKSRLETTEPGERDARAGVVAASLAEEALRWIQPDGRPQDDDLVETATAAGPAPRPKNGRLLIADDNADVRDHLRRLLDTQWTVEVAADGAAALALARRQRPDLVLADVMMPGMDGFALLRAIRDDDALRDTPVILVTAYAGEEAAVEGLKAGADDYVAKPFSARELLARVEGQIQLSRTRRRTQEINEFLVRFSDCARELSAPDAVAQMACRMVAEHLDTEQANWLRNDPEWGASVIEGSFVAVGVARRADGPALIACEPCASACARGQSLVVDDAQADPRLPEATKLAFDQNDVRAAIFVPVIAEGQVRGVLTVSQRAPRRWMPDVVPFLEGVAGRCWAEMRRARSGAALLLAVEQKTMLLTELQHRVRNIMSMIRSINERTAKGARSVDHYASLMTGRLLTLARVQNMLTRRVNAGVNLRVVVREEIAAHDAISARFDIDGPDIDLSQKATEVMAMVMHELVINAFEYGALSAASGRVQIRWTIEARRDACWLDFRWIEQDGPTFVTPRGEQRHGFGSEMIERRIPYELKGRGRLEVLAGGARCSIGFPLQGGASILETGAPSGDGNGGDELTGG
jgi:signal transduction histidine kinase/chemotaxis response regulator CheB